MRQTERADDPHVVRRLDEVSSALADLSQNTNTKLRDIAARVVEGTRRPAP